MILTIPIVIAVNINSIAITTPTNNPARATVTTASAHGLLPGHTVTLASTTAARFDGTFTVLTVPSSTTFTIEVAKGITAQAGAAGTATPDSVPMPNAGLRDRGGRTGIVQFKQSGSSGSLQVQGSLLPTGATGQLWTDLLPTPFTGDNAANITVFPFLRATRPSGTITGTVTVME